MAKRKRTKAGGQPPKSRSAKSSGKTYVWADGERPRVFISYTHEDDEHKRWVRELGEILIKNGIEVRLDQWDLPKGADLMVFMEEGIRWATRVLLVFTPKYKLKAEQRVGGVGYESLVLTGDLHKNLRSTKYIGLLRSGTWERSVPCFLSTRNHIDFREDRTYPESLEELLRELHGSPKVVKPPLGTNPFEWNSPVHTMVQDGSEGLDIAADVQNRTEEDPSSGGSIPPRLPAGVRAAKVSLTHKVVSHKVEKCRCALVAGLSLVVPPTQGEWMLKLQWPSEITITQALNLRRGPNIKIEKQTYRQFVLSSQRRIWPGEAVEAIGPDCEAELEYEIDYSSYDPTWNNALRMIYTLYLEDHAPVSGQVRFGELVPTF